MAHKESDQIPANQNYLLGDYSFRIERSSGTSPNYDKIEAICTKGGKNARKSIQVPSSTKISNWFVEANETEATVYVVVEDVGKVTKTFSENGCTVTVSNAPADIEGHYWTGSWMGNYYSELILISAYPLTGISISGGSQGDAGFSGSVYYNNRVFGGIPAPVAPVFPTTPTHNDSNIAEALWQGGGGDVEEYKTLLVGRFAIDLGDAGGEGPGSDWVDPGDYDDDNPPFDEEEDLYVELDKSDGKAGETFVASITGHRQESMFVIVKDSDGVTKEAYQVSAPATKEEAATVTIITDISWLPDDNYSGGYIVEAETNSTGRTASDSFYLEKDLLEVDISPWEGNPEDVLTATVIGHNGTDVSGIVKNSADETVLNISAITPQDAETAVTISITLDSEWFSDEETFSEGLTLTVTSGDGQEAEVGFTMYIDPEDLDPEKDLFLELDEYYGVPGDTFIASITGHRQETMTLTVTNSENTVVATYSLPAAEHLDDVETQAIQTAINWMPDGVRDAGFTVTVETNGTNRKASASFTLSVEVLYVQVVPYEGSSGETLIATVNGHNGTTVSAVIKNSVGQTLHTFSPVTPANAQAEVEFSILLDKAWFSQKNCLCEAFMFVATSGDGQEASDGFSMITKPKTLYLTVTGASSGTHQSGVYPNPNSKVAWYGCGGDGGHGGGGGAGASTVVVHRFATDKANNKEITAIARQPGVGSGGGAGGKGGDGIILIYY